MILDAARQEFASLGYDGASLRGIARVAGVDARLIHHYFDGKSALFVAVMDVPVDPVAIIAGVTAGPPDEVGVALVRAFLRIWDDPQNQSSLLALVRSGLSNPVLLDQLRGFVEKGLVGQIVAAHPSAAAQRPVERRRRAGLIAVQMLGLIMSRYVVRLPGVADARAEDLVARIGPIIQGALEG